MKKLLLVIASAVLLVLTFPDFNLGFLAWIAFIPLFFAVENQGPVKAFLLSYLFGVLFFIGTIYWLIHVTLPGMIIVSLYLALYFGLFGIFLTHSSSLDSARDRQLTAHSLLTIPSAWVVLEWLRSTGPAGFGWALLGHSQSYNLPVIQIADIVGAYGVSFLVMMVNVSLFLIIKNYKKIDTVTMPIIASAFLVFITLGYGQYRLDNIFTGEKLKVAVVQGDIPQIKKWDYDFRDEILNKYARLTRAASKEKPDLIIWPETSVPAFFAADKEISDMVLDLVKDIKIPVLIGAPREDEIFKEKYYNSAILIGPDGRTIDRYDKLHLVPFGEYVPFKSVFSFVERFARNPIGDFAGGKDYTVFKFFIERSSRSKVQNWKFIKKAKFSCLICFEDIFPDMARDMVKGGANFLVNITNDAWFGKTSAAYQHAQSSVFRAVENRVNVVRAANTGLSCFIDQKGRVVDTVSVKGENLFVDGFKSHDIVLTNTKTLYNAYGDMFVYLCILIAIVQIFNKRFLTP